MTKSSSRARARVPPSQGRAFTAGPDDARFANLRRHLKEEWVTQTRETLDLSSRQLPVLWDIDFFRGGREGEATERCVLCEINGSSVAPFPDSAIPALVEAARRERARVPHEGLPIP